MAGTVGKMADTGSSLLKGLGFGKSAGALSSLGKGAASAGKMASKVGDMAGTASKAAESFLPLLSMFP